MRNRQRGTGSVCGDLPGLAGCAGGNIGDVAQNYPQPDLFVGDCLSLPEVADRLGIPRGRIKQLLRDRKLIAIRQPDGTLGVPAAFLDGDQIVKGLHGTLTLLFDCGFDEPDAVRWLFTADDTLPGTPIQAIAEHRGTEVNRRAQALAF
jgi:Rv2175c C-terminal domain of unknown function/DNA-binding protein Rv2175c, wHTH domain